MAVRPINVEKYTFVGLPSKYYRLYIIRDCCHKAGGSCQDWFKLDPYLDLNHRRLKALLMSKHLQNTAIMAESKQYGNISFIMPNVFPSDILLTPSIKKHSGLTLHLVIGLQLELCPSD